MQYYRVSVDERRLLACAVCTFQVTTLLAQVRDCTLSATAYGFQQRLVRCFCFFLLCYCASVRSGRFRRLGEDEGSDDARLERRARRRCAERAVDYRYGEDFSTTNVYLRVTNQIHSGMILRLHVIMKAHLLVGSNTI